MDLHKITNSKGSKNPTLGNSLRGNLDLKGNSILPGVAGNKPGSMVKDSVQDDAGLVMLRVGAS
jgi:hypothetical protein